MSAMTKQEQPKIKAKKESSQGNGKNTLWSRLAMDMATIAST